MICIKCKKEVPDGPYCCQCGAAQQRKPVNRTRANGTGTAIKRGKTWTVIISCGSYVKENEDGTMTLVRKRKSKGGFRTKTEALEYGQTLAKEPERTMPTLNDLWSSWKKNELPRLSDSKQQAYTIARTRLEPIIHREIASLTTDDLQNVVNENCTSYYTARDVKSLLSHLYNRAMRDQFVQINLSKFLVLPELEEKEAQPFTAEEVKTMWEAYANGERFLGYILLMIYSGMMPAELFACKVDMINWDRHEIYGCGRKTKKRKEVPIIFSDFMEPVLRDLCGSASEKTGKLLAMNKDRFYHKYHKTLQGIGVRDLPPYSCRHTTATDAVKQNASLAFVQQLMRHAKITTTQRYVHLGTEEAHNVANKLTK